MTRPESFIVRLLGSDGEGSAGVGALVGPRRIVTCAHVVNTALGLDQRNQDKPDDLVHIAFPLLEGGAAETILKASVKMWRPPPLKYSATGDDVAGLIIEGDLPEGAVRGQLAKDSPRPDTKLRAYGIPRDRSRGTWAAATMRGPVAGGRLHLDTPLDAQKVRPGYSGGPVINRRDRIVGLVTEFAISENDSYAIDTNVLRRAWPEVFHPEGKRGGGRRRVLLAGCAAVAAAASLSYLLIGTTGVSSTGISTIAVGKFPQTVAIDPAAHAAYVTDYGGESVSVINTRTHIITAAIHVGDWPDGMAVDPAAHAAYVTNVKDDTVWVIDTTTNTPTGTIISVGAAPTSVAVDPAAHVAYVANEGDQSVSVISTVTNAVTKTVPVGSRPLFVTVDSAAHAAYVANADSNSVSIISTVSNTVAATIPLAASPAALGIDPVTHTAYVLDVGGNSVLVINTITKTIAATVPVGNFPSFVAVDPAAHAAYVANAGSNSVSVIDTRTNTVTATVHVGKNPHAVAVDPTTHTAYVANYGDGTVSVIKEP